MPKIAAVRASRMLLIVALVLALPAGGLLPAEHLHHSTPTRPQIVHSHFAPLHPPSSTHAASVAAPDDDHHAAVSLDAQTVSRVPQLQTFGPALAPQVAWVSPPPLSFSPAAVVATWVPESPPRQSTGSRAPPAC